MYEAFRAGDGERLTLCFDEKVVGDTTANIDGRLSRGREELFGVIGEWVSGFENWNEEIEAMHDLDGRVCVVAVQRGRGKDSGIEIATRYAVMYDVRDGVITRMKLYGDPDEALAEAEDAG